MLEFKTCPNCSKSIREDARQCYRCQAVFATEKADDDSIDATEHFATGGYVAEDDFDYEDFIAEEFEASPRRPQLLWYFVTWILIMVMLLTGVLVWSL